MQMTNDELELKIGQLLEELAGLRFAGMTESQQYDDRCRELAALYEMREEGCAAAA